MTRGANVAFVAVALLLLGACATQQGVDLPDISRWESRQVILGQLDKWQFSGRIAVKTSDDGFNGKLRWIQDEGSFRATVSGPLGIGTIRIEGDGDSVEITDKDGTATVLQDIEMELYYRYGWTIPVESLRYWVLGIPDPRVPVETDFDEFDRVSHMKQRGWSVDVGAYREAGGQQMPARLVANSRETSVRLVIDKWVFREVNPLW
jgi:outer membrane lipoprotein LolB